MRRLVFEAVTTRFYPTRTPTVFEQASTATSRLRRRISTLKVCAYFNSDTYELIFITPVTRDFVSKQIKGF